MKQFKTLFLTAIVTLSAFATIIYTSCKKDPCSGVTCQNGGSCDNGSCTCLSGYSGTYCQNSSISFTNDAFTTMNITVNGSTSSVDPGQTIAFVGGEGTNANVTANTAAYTSSGAQVGEMVNLAFSTSFPTDGDLNSQLMDIPASYFYLDLNNATAEYFNTVYVNYGTSAQTADYISVPNTGVSYGIGYYFAYSGTEVYATSPSYYWYYYPTIPNTLNAYVTVYFP